MTLLFASPALAEDPYYFHKMGVKRDAYMDDVNYCNGLAGGIRVPHYQFYATGTSVANSAIAAGLGSFFSTIIERKMRRRLISRVERTCMADKGYERRGIEKSQYDGIKKLKDEEKIDFMFGLVSSAQPSGKVLVE